MTTSEKTGTSLLNPKNTPNCLREADAWMGTRLKKKPNGRIDKPPWRVRRGEKTMPGSKTNREHWASFSEALTALQNGEVAAIGRVFTGDDPFTVIDLDKCRNPETGDITPWALEIVQDMPTYWEVSLSGTGLHGVARAKKNTNHCNRSGVEVYDGNPGSKFMVLTGQHLEGTPTEVRECQTEMDELVRKTFPPDQPKGETRRTPT